MVRVSESVRVIQREVTCHIDLATAQSDTAQAFILVAVSIKK